ncbi:AraC family transcriptional regulator [Euzebyella marina]|uniref:AraC family transcriptional regulator n=1 Tax=Euzebyella marina TaxID=1761453 RepID=A0A3G2LBP0_9FLAO|nr:helix-turn-helix transcriptional regulator [Euzebyella marina]AYN69677.1 AraC family transcriptional regulator [Euzebyella marina]
MNDIVDLFTINDYCSGLNLSALHPLVSVINLNDGEWSVNKKAGAVRYHFYAAFLKQGQNCILKYGRQNYDYQDGTLVFLGPGQVVDISNLDTNIKPSGHALLFHPELIRGTHLGNIIERYSFFSYELHEALHLSLKERQIVLDCFDKISYELSQNIDKHSKGVIVSNIELFLNYCNRFYDRQFITRDSANLGVIEQFESSLNAYIRTGKARKEGMPSVSHFAQEQHLSPNYFGDLVKKETGKSAMEFIRYRVIEIAKDKIFDPDKTISEIAYELGFKHPQHFTRLFKSKVGYSPSDYRMLN